MKNKLFLMLVFLFTALLATSQDLGGVQGVVRDSHTGALIEQAEVLISPLEKGVVSNDKGEYSIKGIKAGSYTLYVKHLGYSKFAKEIHIEGGRIIELDIALNVDIKELLAVEIRDDKIDNHAYSKVVIKEAEIEQRPVRDIGDYLREIPNLYAVRKGGANLDPVIRGFKFSQLNVQVDDGLRMEGGCPNRMDPTTSHVEAGDIEAIEVLKGPFALRYGPVMGGVINMHTSSPRPFEKFQIHVKANLGYESNWNGQREHITVYGGGKKVFFSFSGNNSNYGSYTDGDGNLIRSSFRKFGYNGKLGFALADNHKIILSYSEFYARNVDFPALPMDERADNTKLYSMDYSANNVSKTIESIHVKAYLSDVDHTMDNKERGFSDTVSAVSQILARRYGYRAEFGLNTNKNSHLFVGTDMYGIDKDGDRVKTMVGQYPMMGKVPVKIEDLWNKAHIYNYGLFAEYRYNKNLWEGVAAARVDFNSAYSDSISLTNMMKKDLIGTPADSTKSSFVNISFNLGLTRKINEDMSIGMSFGRGVRSANMIERFIILLPVGYDNFEYLGNPNLLPEANNEFDLVYKYNNQKLGGIELTAFYSIVQNYIGGTYLPPAVQKPLTQGVLGVKKFDNLGTAKLYGLEFSYATPLRYKWRVSYTAALTKGTINEVEVQEFDANGNITGSKMVNNDPLGEIPPMNMNLAFSYKLYDSKLVPALNFRYSAAQNNISTAMQELTTPSFSLLDISLKYKHNENLTVVGGINNVFDKAYYEHLNRRVLGTDSRIYEPGRVFYVNLIFNI
jgi:iron complex outermembrane receptor protein